MMDVTERKQLQAQACRSQRMEAFGQLAGGLAHDFNNFLTTILGYSDLLLSGTAVKGPVANQILEIRDAAGTGLRPYQSTPRFQPSPGARADRSRSEQPY